MAFTRRELLRLGGLGTVAAMLPDARRSMALASPADPASPLDERYLLHGLNVLCNAHATDAFATGHAGGAVISAYYFCREEELEPGTSDVIKGALDTYYSVAPDPFPDEQPAEDGVATLLRSMEKGIEELCRDGHNLIFLSLALKAFHDLPRAATPSRIDELRKTLKALAPRSTGTGDIQIPESIPAFSEFVLDEFLGSTEGVAEQGFAGHLLTNGRAIVDLRTLGHEAFAAKCLNAFQLFVKKARPRSRHKDYREERPKKDFPHPHGKEYWVRRVSAGTMELGHLFKYPYGFYGLRRHSGNQKLNEVCLDNSHRLFAS